MVVPELRSREVISDRLEFDPGKASTKKPLPVEPDTPAVASGPTNKSFLLLFLEKEGLAYLEPQRENPIPKPRKPAYNAQARTRARAPHTNNNTLESPMAWKSPKIVEIALGAEINAYACAEAKK